MNILIDEINFKKCCFSGYRPSKFPFALKKGNADFEVLYRNLTTTISALIEDDCRVFYTGMASGFDIIAAEVVLKFKEQQPDIKLLAVVPFEEQEKTYSNEWKSRYDAVLASCDEVIVLSREYHAGCYQNRNKYMVDNSDYVVTWYDGKQGGTRNTLNYAQKKLRYIVNVNTEYFKEFNNLQNKMDI